MGMYDIIHCEYPLPVQPPQSVIDLWGCVEDIGFQTKDLDNVLALYRIDKEGQLWGHYVEFEFSQEDPNSTGFLNAKNERWEKLITNHVINFYDTVPLNGHDKYGWIEYQAVIQKGKVISIELVKCEEPSNFTEEEIKKNQEIKDFYRKERQKRLNAALKDIKDTQQEIECLKRISETLYERLKKRYQYKDNEGYLYDYVFGDILNRAMNLKKIKEELIV